MDTVYILLFQLLKTLALSLSSHGWGRCSWGLVSVGSYGLLIVAVERLSVSLVVQPLVTHPGQRIASHWCLFRWLWLNSAGDKTPIKLKTKEYKSERRGGLVRGTGYERKEWWVWPECVIISLYEIVRNWIHFKKEYINAFVYVYIRISHRVTLDLNKCSTNDQKKHELCKLLEGTYLHWCVWWHRSSVFLSRHWFRISSKMRAGCSILSLGAYTTYSLFETPFETLPFIHNPISVDLDQTPHPD